MSEQERDAILARALREFQEVRRQTLANQLATPGDALADRPERERQWYRQQAGGRAQASR